jgi:serine O-acetyltransferase
MFDNVKNDIKRYIKTEDVCCFSDIISLFFYNQSLWVILSYRSGRWVRTKFNIPVIRFILKISTRIIHEILCLLTSIQIPFETKIGPGLYIGHNGMLIINSLAIIGANCNIGVGVVIGQGGRGEKKGNPVIGDFVYIGVGAKIIGNIRIGDNVAIGANAVVTKDVPPNATVAGIPAKIINYLGSKDFIRY